MKWEAKTVKHKGESRIAVYFDKDAVLIERIKAIEGSRWSMQLRAWHLPDTDENRIRFRLTRVVNTVPDAEGIAQIERFKQWIRSKRYSENTITTYSEALRSFLVFYREKSVKEITNEDTIIFNNEYILKNSLSASYQNQIVNAVKLFFKTTQDTRIEIDKIHRPKNAINLPNVLSKEEVFRIIDATNNLKHKTLLALIYSSGLRISEALNIKANR